MAGIKTIIRKILYGFLWALLLIGLFLVHGVAYGRGWYSNNYNYQVVPNHDYTAPAEPICKTCNPNAYSSGCSVFTPTIQNSDQQKWANLTCTTDIDCQSQTQNCRSYCALPINGQQRYCVTGDSDNACSNGKNSNNQYSNVCENTADYVNPKADPFTYHSTSYAAELQKAGTVATWWMGEFVPSQGIASPIAISYYYLFPILSPLLVMHVVDSFQGIHQGFWTAALLAAGYAMATLNAVACGFATWSMWAQMAAVVEPPEYFYDVNAWIFAAAWSATIGTSIVFLVSLVLLIVYMCTSINRSPRFVPDAIHEVHPAMYAAVGLDQSPPDAPTQTTPLIGKP